jgi:hypothetical protein
MIQLVAAGSAMFDGPELSGFRMKRRRLNVPMSVGPDLRFDAGASDERIVARNAAVGVDADDLSDRRGEILRPVAIVGAIALRDEHRAVIAKDDARPEVVVASDFRLLAINDANVLQSRVAKSRPRGRGA